MLRPNIHVLHFRQCLLTKSSIMLLPPGHFVEWWRFAEQKQHQGRKQCDVGEGLVLSTWVHCITMTRISEVQPSRWKLQKIRIIFPFLRPQSAFSWPLPLAISQGAEIQHSFQHNQISIFKIKDYFTWRPRSHTLADLYPQEGRSPVKMVMVNIVEIQLFQSLITGICCTFYTSLLLLPFSMSDHASITPNLIKRIDWVFFHLFRAWW